MTATDTPIYDRLVVEHAGQQARDYVRKHFNACSTCGATPGTACTTKGGKATLRHKARRWV